MTTQLTTTQAQKLTTDDILLQLKQSNDLIFEICGSWLWISGNTKEHKEQLKTLGCRFSAKKRAWYYSQGMKNIRHSKYNNIDELRNKFGTQILNTTNRLT